MRLVTNKRRRIAHIVLVCAVLLGALGIAAAPVSANQYPEFCELGDYVGGQYLICVPPGIGWNGDLVVYAHGYVAPENPIAIPEDQLVLPDGTSIPETILGLGYAFAATSYRTNGLAVEHGVTDLVELVDMFKDLSDPDPGHVYLVGASEGGLNTALAVEQEPDVFDGGVAACGPVGDFHRQTNYWGDVRVLFDYFFPGVLPKFEPEKPVPQKVISTWYWCENPDRNPFYPCTDKEKQAYENRVRDALMKHSDRTRQLLAAANVPVTTSDPDANVDALVQVLWYNVFAVNDAVDKLNGQPYDNKDRWYSGSDNDWRLNHKVARFEADATALEEIEGHYQTSGELDAPLVTMHTTGDPTVPYWHEPLYRAKVWANRDWWRHINLPILRYGHCNFEPQEVLFAFALLRLQVEGFTLFNADDVLTTDQYRDYERLMERHELAPSLKDR